MKPTVTFIIPVKEEQDFLIEQINAIFKFSENYQGFCEIILPTDNLNHPKLNLALLAIKLNKVTHPHVKARQLYFTQETSVEDLIENSVNHALGEKIIIVLNTQKDIENLHTNGYMNRELIIAKYALNTQIFEEILN